MRNVRGERRTRPGTGRPGVNMVGKADFRSYYGRPILKRPVWTWEVPAYMFLGGIAGAAAPLAFAARLTGNEPLRKAALKIGASAILASPPLLISDLGRPERFHHMLRVLKPTSPMSVGSWILAALAPAQVGAAVADQLGIFPRLARVAEGAAAVLGPPLATYTAVLLADTAIPVWHEGGPELPFVFAAGGAASASGAICILLDPADAGPARRLAIGAGVTELAAVTAMERRLGELGEPYELPPARRFTQAAKLGAGLGAAVLALAGRRRAGAALGGALLLAGAACERVAVFKAGPISAADPKYVVKPQRERLAGSS